jgi:predicted AlkP superfamily pyrophosphatase or phosphodiesterase
MSCRPIYLWLIVALFIYILIKPAAAETLSTQSNGTSSSQSIQQVFLISVDGLNYEGFISSYTPNMNFLGNEGAIDEKSVAFIANSTEASEASLITGSFPEEHKFISADDSLEVESLLALLQNSNKKVLMVDASGGKLEKLAPGDYINREIN